jgi:hypothetical protein
MKRLGINIDDHDILVFNSQTACDMKTDLPCTHNNNFQGFMLLMMIKIAFLDNYVEVYDLSFV